MAGLCSWLKSQSWLQKYDVSIIVSILNNGYFSLIRQNQVYTYDYEFAVNLFYENNLVDFVKIAEGCEAQAEKIEKPGDIKMAFG